jgi:hypothetical protein
VILTAAKKRRPSPWHNQVIQPEQHEALIDRSRVVCASFSGVFRMIAGGQSSDHEFQSSGGRTLDGW